MGIVNKGRDQTWVYFDSQIKRRSSNDQIAVPGLLLHVLPGGSSPLP